MSGTFLLLSLLDNMISFLEQTTSSFFSGTEKLLSGAEARSC